MNYFDRVPREFRPHLEIALDLIPAKVRDTVQPKFLCGISPHFVGLHSRSVSELGSEYKLSDYSYEDLAHAELGSRTVVYPKLALYADPVDTFLHEYGHMYDQETGFSFPAPESTSISETNDKEAFAELFQVVLRPSNADWRQWVESAEWVRPFRELLGLKCA